MKQELICKLSAYSERFLNSSSTNNFVKRPTKNNLNNLNTFTATGLEDPVEKIIKDQTFLDYSKSVALRRDNLPTMSLASKRK